MNESHTTPLTQDAALVAALAATAMPFSRSAEAQAESWIRTIRLHGRVGSAMQALGVGEAPLRAEYDLEGTRRPPTPVPEGDVAERVVDPGRTSSPPPRAPTPPAPATCWAPCSRSTAT